MKDAKFLVDVKTAFPATDAGANWVDLKPAIAFLPVILDAVLDAAVRIIIDVVVLMVAVTCVGFGPSRETSLTVMADCEEFRTYFFFFGAVTRIID